MNGETDENGNWREPEVCFIEEPVSSKSPGNYLPNRLSVFPTPATASIRIEGMRIESARIHNQNGKLVATYGAGNHIDISLLPNGVYVLTAFDHTGGIGTARVIVNR